MSATDDRNRKIAVWTASAVLAAAFVVAGGAKLTPGSEARDNFALWGYPDWFRLVIAAAEIAGGLGLLVPKLAPFAASGLVLVMGGAAFTHLRTEGEANRATVPIALAVLLLGVAIARFRDRRAK